MEDNKLLKFVLWFICGGIVLSLIGWLIRVIISLVEYGINSHKVKSHNKNLITVVKLLYKYKIKKEELSEKEVKKLIEAMRISGIRQDTKEEEIKNCTFESDQDTGKTYVIFDDNICILPSLAECGIR